MPKPIFIIEFPKHISFEEMQDAIDGIKNDLEIARDYYLLYIRGNFDEFRFQCFYEKDFNDVKYEELKQIILDKLDKTKEAV